MENVLEFELNAFHVHSILLERQLKKRKSNDFLKGRTNHRQLLVIFFHETKKTLMFSSCNHSHPSDPRPNKPNYSLRELVE